MTQSSHHSFAIVFPGQGSQSVGMMDDIASAHPVVEQTFKRASEVLNFDLWNLVQNGPVEALNQTENTQPAMLVAGVAMWRVWRERGGPMPAMMAGHSLGEYTALVCSGAIEFADAISVVAERAKHMQAAVPLGEGAVAAILGLDDGAAEQICLQSSELGVVSAANYNSPGQVVIAGKTAAVNKAIELAKEQGARRAVLLPVSVPVHCELMKPAADALTPSLQALVISQPEVPVVQHVDAQIQTDVESIREQLIEQVYRPVRWSQTVRTMHEAGVQSVIELGPGKVLAGLCKRIVKGMGSAAVFNDETMTAALDAVQGE